MSDTAPETVINELPARFLPEVAGTTKVLVQHELSGEGRRPMVGTRRRRPVHGRHRAGGQSPTSG